MLSNRRIDLMIVGAQKSGTTSLKNYLGQHPEVITHLQTEYSYFVRESEFKEGFDAAFRNYFPKTKNDADKFIVAKNAGMYINESSLERLKEHNPGCKLVFLLRHPAERAFSSYQMEITSGYFHNSWSEIERSLERFNHGERDQMFRLFIDLSLYSLHLKKILRHFPKEQVSLITYDEFIVNTQNVCGAVFKTLRIDDSFVPDVSQRFNPTVKPRIDSLYKFITWLRFNHNPIKRFLKYMLPRNTFTKLGNLVVSSASIEHRPLMDAESRKLLNAFFKRYNAELEEMTGLSLSHWDS